jgi:hypothetical protein
MSPTARPPCRPGGDPALVHLSREGAYCYHGPKNTLASLYGLLDANYKSVSAGVVDALGGQLGSSAGDDDLALDAVTRSRGLRSNQPAYGRRGKLGAHP